MAHRLLNVVSCALGISPGKPFKVQDVNATRRVGVVASTLNELRKKGGVKLRMEEVDRVVLEEDGSEVDDEEFFGCLKDNTVLIFLEPGEVWHGYITYLKMASSKIIDNMTTHRQTMEDVEKFLYDPDSPEVSLLVEYVHTLHANVEGETRGEDPDWFEGVQERHKTKRETMRDAAKQRIRNYLYKTKEYVDKTPVDKNHRDKLSHVLEKFTKELKKNQYFAEYFDRTRGKRKNTENTKVKSSDAAGSVEAVIPDVQETPTDATKLDESHTSDPGTVSSAPVLKCNNDWISSAEEIPSLAISATETNLESESSTLTAIGKPLQRQLCSDKGWFCCEGAFDAPSCGRHHSINPYASKQSRVLFSTWNLDHQIEKSRCVLPSLVEAVTSCPDGMVVNWRYYFELLFTLRNLRLVDIRCHKKSVHGDCRVDEKMTLMVAPPQSTTVDAIS